MTRSSFFQRSAPALVLIVLSVVAVLARVQTYDEPLENDVAGYAVIGHEMIRGRKLYSDLWDRKPPLLYMVFEGAELVWGPGRQAVFAVNITCALLSLLAIYAAARIASATLAGLLAASLWVLLGGDLFLQANQPNAEALANPCLTAAIALLLFQLKHPKATRWWIHLAVGLLFAAATLIKHHLIAFAAVILVAYLVAGERTFIFRRLRHIAIASVTIAGCWIITIGYFAATGRLNVLTEILAVQIFSYTGNPSVNLLASLTPSAIATVSLAWVVAPVMLLLGAFAMGDRSWRSKPIAIVWFAWLIAAWLGEALPGRLFPHYFQFWIPFWCVTGGVAAAALINSTRNIPRPLRYGVILAAFAFALIRQGQVLRLTADQWADVKYPGGNYTQQKYLGRYLATTLLYPGETFWVGGDDVSLYFESNISPPTGLLFIDPLIQGATKQEYNRRLVADLSVHPPDLILLTPLIERFPPGAPIFPWIGEHYQPWSTPIGGRVYRFIYVRRDSPLAQRVLPAGR